MEEKGIRLNKYLSEAGVCSRRGADKLIEDGAIYIDGRIATLGDRVFDDTVVTYEGKRINITAKNIVIAYNKPVGQVCTAKGADDDSIFNFVEFPTKVNYVGRLDKDSTGLLLLTNDGDLSNSIQKSRNNHEKEYFVRVNKDVTDDFLDGLRRGVYILDQMTKPCKVSKTGARTFKIVLTQGLNRQIRRMCDALGFRVVFLKRVRVMNVNLGNLKPGEFRVLSKEEEEKLYKMVLSRD